MAYVIQLVGLANGARSPDDGRFLEYYDPAAFNGAGEIRTTPYRIHAIHFPTMEQAMLCYHLQSGIRLDGKPNKPLTAYHVVVGSTTPIEVNT